MAIRAWVVSGGHGTLAVLSLLFTKWSGNVLWEADRCYRRIQRCQLCTDQRKLLPGRGINKMQSPQVRKGLATLVGQQKATVADSPPSGMRLGQGQFGKAAQHQGLPCLFSTAKSLDFFLKIMGSHWRNFSK